MYPEGWGKLAALIVFIVEEVALRQHGLMQNAGNQYAAGHLAVEDNVLSGLHATQTGADTTARSARCGTVREAVATRFQLGEVAIGLSFTPGFQGICADA